MNVETSEGMSQRGINFGVIDHDFVETLGIEMAVGRDFQEDMPSDTLLGVIVNQTLAERLAWDEPLGKKVEVGDENTLRAEVVGVMKDFYQTGMYNEIESFLLIYRIDHPLLYVKMGENTEEALALARLADEKGVKNGVVQDKLWLPGFLKLQNLIKKGFFGRIFAVRGEFGYWVFEGDVVPINRPSWNYRKEDGGGIILDMLCHWRYVLDNIFGKVKAVSFPLRTASAPI